MTTKLPSASRLLSLALLFTGIAGGTAMANTINLYQVGGYYYGDGGEFTAVAPGLNLDAYSPLASGVSFDSFQTFCVADDLFFYPGATYTYTLGSLIPPSPGTPVTEGVAWLYYQFATGQLAGYDYTAGAGREASANDLQQAIWMLQGNIPTTPNPYITLVNTLFGAGATAPVSGNLANEVSVVLLVGQIPGGQGVAQPQLFLNPVAEGGNALLLLGAGLLALAVWHRTSGRQKTTSL